MNQKLLQNKLDQILIDYGKKELLEKDPLYFLHQYKRIEDQEVVGILAASFAYGNVGSFMPVLGRLFEVMAPSPFEYLKKSSETKISKEIKASNIYYRFYTNSDVLELLLSLKRFLKNESSIGSCFKQLCKKTSVDEALQGLFLKILPEKVRTSNGLRYFFADPTKGTAKRAWMLLRWLVRKDSVDLGIWGFLSTDQLTIPLDTHVFKMSQILKMTDRKVASKKAAIEITNFLKRIDPVDPIKYDFALCRIGVLREIGNFKVQSKNKKPSI